MILAGKKPKDLKHYMTRCADTLKTILDAELCVGCGLCESIAGSDSLRMEITSAGQIRPVQHSDIPSLDEQLIISVCPGTNVTAQDQTTPYEDPVWGPAFRIAKGFANDQTIRHTGASGGVLTAIADYLLQRGEAEFVLHVANSMESPLIAEPQYSSTRSELLKGAGSWYTPVAPLKEIHSLLDQGRRFIIIAKPCDIAAMRNLASRDNRVDELVPFMFSFFCGGVAAQHANDQIVAHHGLSTSNVRSIRHRGLGCPGPTRVTSNDGQIFDISYKQAWNGDLTLNMQFRCKICPDGVGELADITVGDIIEPSILRESGQHSVTAGYDAIIARTEHGLALLRDLEEGGVISLSPITFEDLNRCQPHQVRRKQALLPAMHLVWKFVPVFSGFGLFRNACRLGLTSALRTFLSMCSRLRQKQHLWRLGDY